MQSFTGRNFECIVFIRFETKRSQTILLRSERRYFLTKTERKNYAFCMGMTDVVLFSSLRSES
jgi:hypothetical protein